MGTTIEIPAERFPQRQYDGPIVFTYGGADPEDPGPAGRLMKALIAQARGDREALSRLATARTMEMAEVKPPGQRIGVEVGEPQYEGDGSEHRVALVPTRMMEDGQQQGIEFVMVRQDGQWMFDMSATMERVFGVCMEGFGKAMGEAMGALGEGMTKAFGDGDGSGVTPAPNEESDGASSKDNHGDSAR